jgi:signal transduction histidine kinase
LENAEPAKAFEEIQKIDVPIILTDEEGNPKFWKNVDIAPQDSSDAAIQKLKGMLKSMDRVVEPIPLEYTVDKTDYFHYGDSNLVAFLRMMPYLFVFVAGLFVMVGYLGFKHIKDSEQRSVWVGMARETAHQLGTPLSSLLGWMELLKSGDANEKVFAEMDKDIARLEQITARFSQIGSEVKLQNADLLPIVSDSIRYYRRRIPQSGKHISLVEDFREQIETMVNPYLLGWVIENLIRNGIDAISAGEGRITVSVAKDNGSAFIDVTDTGCGIDPANKRNIFRPGYTTKHRGWGVGLSLSKRIIEDYHGGKLSIRESHLNEGTTIRISLPIK